MLSARDIQRKLNRDKVIIEYVFNDSETVPEVYSFIISSEKLDFKKLNVNPVFRNSGKNVDFTIRCKLHVHKRKMPNNFVSNQMKSTIILFCLKK